jgi:hypothetical protein
VGFLIAILTLALIALVVVVVGAPLRRARLHARSSEASPSQPGDAPSSLPAYVRDELDAAREAKYREIRDAELDYRTGKLSREDYEAIDAGLRAEAIEILNRLEGSDRATPAERSNGSMGAPDA